MSFIDPTKAVGGDLLQPTYSVQLQAYQPGQLEVQIIGQSIKVANDSSLNVPSYEAKIPSDKLVTDSRILDFFRHALADITMRLKSDRVLVETPPAIADSSTAISDFLRPMFNMSSKHDYLSALGEVVKAKKPIPRDYVVFLPEEGSSFINRDDVIRVLVPFEQARREALKAAWYEKATILRIRHDGVSDRGLVLH